MRGGKGGQGYMGAWLIPDPHVYPIGHAVCVYHPSLWQLDGLFCSVNACFFVPLHRIDMTQLLICPTAKDGFISRQN